MNEAGQRESPAPSKMCVQRPLRPTLVNTRSLGKLKDGLESHVPALPWAPVRSSCFWSSGLSPAPGGSSEPRERDPRGFHHTVPFPRPHRTEQFPARCHRLRGAPSPALSPDLPDGAPGVGMQRGGARIRDRGESGRRWVGVPPDDGGVGPRDVQVGAAR